METQAYDADLAMASFGSLSLGEKSMQGHMEAMTAGEVRAGKPFTRDPAPHVDPTAKPAHANTKKPSGSQNNMHVAAAPAPESMPEPPPATNEAPAPMELAGADSTAIKAATPEASKPATDDSPQPPQQQVAVVEAAAAAAAPKNTSDFNVLDFKARLMQRTLPQHVYVPVI